MNLNEIRAHLENAKEAMARSPGDTLVQQGYVRNLIALAETELKIHELDKTDTATGKLVEIVRTLGYTAETLKDAATKAENSSSIQARQTNAVIFWTAALVIATFIMAGMGYFQMREAQKLTKVSQEQIDLQLQPALMVKTDNPIGGSRQELYLVNIGNGPAVNIDITSDNDSRAFVLLSHLLESKEQASIYVVYGPKDKNNLTEKEIYNSYPEYDFSNEQSLILNISYTNIKNRPYFSKVKISKFKIELVSMGERIQ